jgi:hypothetical protein
VLQVEHDEIEAGIVRHEGHGGILDHAHHAADSSLAVTKFLNSHEIISFVGQSV